MYRLAQLLAGLYSDLSLLSVTFWRSRLIDAHGPACTYSQEGLEHENPSIINPKKILVLTQRDLAPQSTFILLDRGLGGSFL